MQKKIFYYAAIGMISGSLFPISSLIYESISKNIPFSIYGLEMAHSQNEVLYLIDLIPIIFGSTAWLIGLNLVKNISRKKDMETLLSELLNTNAELLEFKKNSEDNCEMLYKESITDKLTGLENRKSFAENFKNNKDMVIFLLNISHFSEINSIFGYSTGDLILIDFSKRLKNRGFDCYRLDGDEFGIIFFDKETFLEVDSLANEIFDIISEEAFLINGEEIFLTIHLGISIIDRSEYENNIHNSLENNVQEFVHRANFALKYAKENRMQHALYNSDLVRNMESRYSYHWKEKIISAIKEDKVTAFYQPIINNKTMKPEKFETLMRIEDNKRYISPNEFLLSSKKYGLYNQLTKIIVNKALETIEKTNSEVSINISIDDIRNISTMSLILDKLQNFSKDKTENIVFEFLESEGIENYDEIKEFINIIKKYNCKIAIDDFGSGYSNFSHILNLDIDYIKIDSSIIKNIDSDKNSEYIAKLMVEFANNIGVKTIAEFVHSKEVFEKVKQLGIDYSQGYYFSEPKIEIETS